MAIILKNAPKTEEGWKLNLSKEDEEKYKLVFLQPGPHESLRNLWDFFIV